MQIIPVASLPYVQFGQDPPRQIRLVASPWTTGSAMVIVHCTLPPGGVSDEHAHPDADEYIHFDIAGACAVDGVVHPVQAGEVILVRRGERHEARNLSPDQVLTLYCVFSPAFQPYGGYPELIARTRAYLAEQAASLEQEDRR